MRRSSSKPFLLLFLLFLGVLFFFPQGCTPLATCWDNSDCPNSQCTPEGVCLSDSLLDSSKKLPPGLQKKDEKTLPDKKPVNKGTSSGEKKPN